MPSKVRQKKIMEKLNRAQKCSILGPQNLGSRGGGPPPLDPHLKRANKGNPIPFFAELPKVIKHSSSISLTPIHSQFRFHKMSLCLFLRLERCSNHHYRYPYAFRTLVLLGTIPKNYLSFF